MKWRSAMTIKSYVGGHPVAVFRDAVYDPAIRKYRGGILVGVIPYAGRMLSARMKPQKELPPVEMDGNSIPVRSAPEWESADPVPDRSECDYALVSAMYLSACKELGLDTSRLLTIGGSVVDDTGKVIGTAWLNHN